MISLGNLLLGPTGFRMKTDIQFMQAALFAANQAGMENEIPIGALLVQDQTIIARAHNKTISLHDPTAHAEILAIREAGKKLKNYRLPGLTLYVTLEPCIMCMGALIHARIQRIVYGAKDLKWGGCGSLYHMENDHRLNHKIKVNGGVCENECRQIIQSFFKEKRNNNNG
jgi:tRNA(adenine34) deaminase